MRYLITTMLMLGPRLAVLIWCTDPARISLAFHGWPQLASLPFPLLVWPLAGAVLAPWTTWVYLMVVGGGVTGFEWFALGLSLLIDVGAHASTVYPRYGRAPSLRSTRAQGRQGDEQPKARLRA